MYAKAECELTGFQFAFGFVPDQRHGALPAAGFGVNIAPPKGISNTEELRPV